MTATTKYKVLLIAGPTAVGKTALSLALAKQLNGEIISGDSMQVYRHLDIGTAKIMPAEQAGIPHHLIDIKDVNQRFTVAEFVSRATTLINGISARGKLPIIVGGTGFYLQSLLAGYQFGPADKAPDMTYRQVWFDRAAVEGPLVAWTALQERDPRAAAAIAPANLVRVVRALEYQHTTGQRFSDQADTVSETLDAYTLCLTADRTLLYNRINQRVDQMVAAGLAQEARWLFDQGGATIPAGKGIGYHEWFPYFDGEQSLDETIAAIKQDSRRYAKRQLTWFRNKMTVDWVNLLEHPELRASIDQQLASWLS
ncbi:tRNA (adenosine(37)-N6)-dimethylallyltransferase MiaA [Lactiplantibacillus sp. DA1]|uniref:tRNA (adenosine(37)-N6)-dimethylallyltransferase MiaA n=1 Tax=Lactiplantibacillus sp. DA1 TaxID=3079857 RepID=UPI00292A6480|nr:tRNA (adenosine(37)-N6)-dimethylallyltransferase MiaA [Lactiplantibacillus sp. DA1]MDV0430875.1 tRNA (adenosine(37)-N6)-dimethylallyltransferase MiaA [Lactiplantibacillus sp. DA1]